MDLETIAAMVLWGGSGERCVGGNQRVFCSVLQLRTTQCVPSSWYRGGSQDADDGDVY